MFSEFILFHFKHREDNKQLEISAMFSDFIEFNCRHRDDYKQPEIWVMFLELYLFYLLHTNDVPDELHETLHYCGNTFWYLYDRNPYKVLITSLQLYNKKRIITSRNTAASHLKFVFLSRSPRKHSFRNINKSHVQVFVFSANTLETYMKLVMRLH